MKRVIFESENAPFLKLAYPDASLQRVVEYYFEVDTQHEANIMGLPSVNTVLAIHLNKSGRSLNEKTGQWIPLPRMALLGNTSVIFCGQYLAASTTFYVKLKPAAKSLLFDYPGAELLNNQMDVEDTLKGFGFSRFQDLANFQQRVAFVEDYFKRTIDLTSFNYKQSYIESLFKQFSRACYARGENIEALCAKLHVTYASMRRYCVQELGVSPKFYQRTLRFKAALRAYKLHGYNFNAFDFGYTDFSHFCKDAYQLAGRQPAAL